MRELRRKVLLPVFQLSELTTADDPRALKRVIKQGIGRSALTYHYRFVWDGQAGQGFNYNLFPVVLDRNAAPWPLGTLYILAQLEAEAPPAMATYQSRADDLGAYKEWLDTQNRPDDLMFQFPKIKLRRPTYRYRGYLQQLIQARELAPATAKRRMGTVVAFYRWLIDNNYFQPEYPPWEEKRYQLFFKNTEGFSVSKSVVSTDVSIRAPKSEDPFAGTIQDGGKLRPLIGKEQNWILEATEIKGNTECYLIQLFMLATGARIQTAGTLRLRHFTQPNPGYAKSLTGEGEVFKLKAGPGTGIDTKNDKSGVLQVPRPIYELLRTYALSERTKVRKGRFVAKHGEHPDPYLFLTQQGNPYYTAKAEALCFNPDLDRRYEKTGQPVRQFIQEHVIPYVREHHDKNFHYRIHDLRASFGMNMTEQMMELVQQGTITLSRARMTVKDLLWHESFATTDLYLNYRSQMDVIYEAVNGYGRQLQEWIEQAMKGMEVTHE
ncbi:site-specific integrase [Azospira sp. I09]|uniref:site-specific integrase n=1 Tax=Azospira sp. I09 TaxID=1765049 RepID=UPI001260B51B|nr:site-specific integrase [Azospira sp. I09]BBN90126.1 integrase [Azospira sp. I09]